MTRQDQINEVTQTVEDVVAKHGKTIIAFGGDTGRSLKDIPAGAWILMDENERLCEDVFELLESLKNIHAELRPEITRVNEAAGQTIFNPTATLILDEAKDLVAKISKANGYKQPFLHHKEK